MKLFNHRKYYDKDSLSINELGANPINFFKKWFKDAEKNDQIIESNAMTVSTVDNSGHPSSRVVLLKEIKDKSLIFFTNYKSKKGKEINDNPNICAYFYWAPLERQVIFKGIAKKTSEDYSDIYFKSRPFSSQVGAIISNQSETITSYDDLLIKYDGYIQNIDKIPNILKERYKTIWELKQKDIIDMSIDRGKYICQSQSLNLFLQSPDISTLTSMHFYSWQKGLKTGIYYLRSRPSSKAIQFTISANTECENCSG